MDIRKALPGGTELPFPGMRCVLQNEIGRGSNAVVYKAVYPDLLNGDEAHTVLVKELFPFHPKGAIYRDKQGNIVCGDEGLEIWEAHRRSFEYGNRVHLRMREKHPDLTGENTNTFALNGSLYTVLGYTGGRSLSGDAASEARDLRRLTVRMLGLLDALEAFHDEGYLHLDIAPDNVLLIGADRKERVMLIDYNSVHDRNAVQRESADSFSVKAGYTAPEIRTGKTASIAPASDLYSVSAVFYHCLTGTALTAFQMIRPCPPDVSCCAGLREEPDTVRAMVRQILRRGLQTLPERRYQSVPEMREAMQELLDRIDGVGITHWALWEAGTRNVRRAIRENPSLAYVQNTEDLFPTNATSEDGVVFSMQDYIAGMLEPDGKNTLLTAPGGMGKTTALLRAVILQSGRYAPTQSAVVYIPLYGRKRDDATFICDRILENLRFKGHTPDFESARHALRQLLDQPLRTRAGECPALLILLDGLNEASGVTEGLIAEINELAAHRGVRLLVSTRSEESSIPFARVRLSPMAEEEVRERLAKYGLLEPESVGMRQLLKTPLMLSIFLQSAGTEGKQLSVRTQDELMAAYLASLREKELRRLPEDTEARWQIDAAVSFVLPSIAGELQKKQRAMNDKELLRCVERCYHLFSDRLLRKAFPQWIGHSQAIRGNTANAEEWYGLIIHDLLWKRLGLLIRTEPSGYRVLHQVIGEYLVTLDRDNSGKILKRKRLKGYLALGALLLAMAAGAFVYSEYIRPRPYGEEYAEAVFDYGLGAYRTSADQYDAIRRLVDCAMEEPERYTEQLGEYENSVRFEGLGLSLNDYVLSTLEKMLSTGKVMPWSRKPLDEQQYRELLELAQERKEEYARYVAVLTYVMEDERANRLYGNVYPEQLSVLIDLDADIAAVLYQLVCEPHVTGKYSDGSPETINYESILKGAVLQNRHLTDVTDLSVLNRKLNTLRGERTAALEDLNSCGALAAYQYEEGEI